MKKLLAVTALLAVGSWGSVAFSQDQAARPDADNTRVNKADSGNTQQTAQGQSQAKADRELAAAVRKAIVDDKSLSTYAKNVKVIARGSSVTLRGPVNSSAEKAKVAELAQQVPNVQAVDNRVTVKSSKESTSTKRSAS